MVILYLSYLRSWNCSLGHMFHSNVKPEEEWGWIRRIVRSWVSYQLRWRGGAWVSYRLRWRGGSWVSYWLKWQGESWVSYRLRWQAGAWILPGNVTDQDWRSRLSETKETHHWSELADKTSPLSKEFLQVCSVREVNTYVVFTVFIEI